MPQAASRGDADALLFLGLMIKAGEFVAPDCEKSCMAFKQCGERGPWSHLLNQGFMAWNAGDKLGAFLRYRLAAELGYRTALANIGFIYEHGIDDDAFPVAQVPLAAVTYRRVYVGHVKWTCGSGLRA